MNYGDRQQRALGLLKALREHADQTQTFHAPGGGTYTLAEIADAIEQETPLGRAIVASSGTVFQTKRK